MFLLLGATIVGLLASLSRLSAESNVSNDRSAYSLLTSELTTRFFTVVDSGERERERKRSLFQWRCIYSSEIYRVNERRKEERDIKSERDKREGDGEKGRGEERCETKRAESAGENYGMRGRKERRCERTSLVHTLFLLPFYRHSRIPRSASDGKRIICVSSSGNNFSWRR